MDRRARSFSAIGAAILVVALAAVVADGVTHLGFLTAAHRHAFVAWTLIAWGVFAAAVAVLRFTNERWVPALVIGGGALVGIAALLGPPNTSTDSARYAWDGIVQLHGISPYAHVPAAHVLADLRPSWLFPAPVTGAAELTCPGGQRIMVSHDTATGTLLCTAINRSTVPTIYPPMAELWFALVRLPVPASASYLPMQVACLLVAVGVSAGLLLVLRRSGRPLWWAALWAWCPLVASEGITNAHVDMLGAALTTAGAVLVAYRRPVLGGIVLGAATATKLIPALVFPALVGRRRNWWAVLAAVATFALLYVPYVISTGVRVIGFLPGYLNEEGYDDGTRFTLMSAILPGSAATIAVAVVILIAAVLSWRLADPSAPWSAEVLMVGVTLLAVSPRYPWYALILIPFVALSGRWEWLTIGLAMLLRQMHPSEHSFRLSLLAAIAIIVLVSALRAEPSDWRRWHARLLPRRRAGSRTRPGVRAGVDTRG